jgi:uncharacterized membrane protein HdeD (DUF308 family)
VVYFLLGSLGLAIDSLGRPTNLLHAGFLLLSGGSAQLLHTMVVKDRLEEIPQLAISLFYLLAGLTILSSPGLDSRATIFIFSLALLGIGVSRILVAHRNRESSNWIWILTAGIATCLLAIFITAGWPGARLELTGVAITAELIFNGWSCLILAQAARNPKRSSG